MNFPNIKLILVREIRDQLRDRRTLFMMLVLPILLYPLLGMSFFQISQFMHERPTSVLVMGAKDLVDLAPLIENRQFAADLFDDPSKARLLDLHFAADEPPRNGPGIPNHRPAARKSVQAGTYDAALYFPGGFADEMQDNRQRIKRTDPSRRKVRRIPKYEIIYTTANEKSQIAFARLSAVLDRWTNKVGETNLAAVGVPVSAAKPFRMKKIDVADETSYRGAALWSKILPVLLLIWALTGAFYPAVDLCAGEKERGTLETLLSSPARRSEIVLGKLLTIMLFSMVTAVLNLLSIGLTGWLVFGDHPQFAAPPPMAILWLLVALVPISALFSALCLALAAFARSTKEGQYYLMPLLLITMPLAMLPMTPGVELNLGNSLIPVTGVVVLLRTVLEGDYLRAVQFLPAVLGVTLAACMLAIRWAVDQFNSESVLFRESELLDVRLWLRRLLRNRRATPTVAAAAVCATVILLIQFFLNTTMSPSSGWSALLKAVLLPQLVAILAPVLLMTVLLTKSPRQTLLLRRPPWLAIPAVLLLAVVLHPAVNALKIVVMRLYPMSESLKQAVAGILPEDAHFWHLVLLVAVVPAICEELAFRGFILSGFCRFENKWRAIVYTALLFGIAHGLLQQQLIACLVGMVIGFIAVQSGSILPCAIFHMLHNTLGLATVEFMPQLLARWPILKNLVSQHEEVGYAYHWSLLAAGSFVAVMILSWFGRLPGLKSAESPLHKDQQRGMMGQPLAASQEP